MKESKKLKDIMREESRKRLIPTGVKFELTPRCNLNCKMCYVHLTKNQMGEYRELSAQEWIKIMSEAIDAGMLYALLTGGECLLHPGFKDIYLYLKQQPVVVEINTNATLLNDEYVKFFTKNPPAAMHISLYGVSDEGYERVTGKRVFSLVRDNILKLKSAGINIKINITVSKFLYDEAAEVVKFAVQNNIPFLISMTMSKPNDDTGRSHDDFAVSPEKCAQKYVEIREMLGQKIYDRKNISELPQRKDTTTVEKSLHCGAGRNAALVNWKGHVCPCFSIDKNTLSAVDYGFLEAWKRATELSRDFILPIECVDCKYAKVCRSCALDRSNPDDPGHCNPMICKTTIAKINAGVIPWDEE